MRELFLALVLAHLIAACSWFDPPTGSSLVVECSDKSGAAARVDCGRDDDNVPPIPE